MMPELMILLFLVLAIAAHILLQPVFHWLDKGLNATRSRRLRSLAKPASLALLYKVLAGLARSNKQ
jgi:hypothetical protein